MSSDLGKYRYSLIGTGIFVLNFVLKFWHISTPEIGMDEPFTIYYAHADLDLFLAILPHENNPPLFTFILKAWISVFGTDAWSVRFLPTVFSAFSAVILFQIGRRFFSERIGWIAVGIFTFATCHYYYAHEARPYALFVLLTLASIYSYLRLLVHGSKKHLYWLALFNVLLIYNHFFGFLILFVQALVFITDKPSREKYWKSILLSWGITVLLYAPYIPLFFKRFFSSTGGTWLSSPDTTGLYTELWRFSNQPVNTVIFIALLLSALTFTFIQGRRKSSLGSRLVVIWFVFCFFGMFLISFKLPIFLDRYLVFISPAFYLLIAISVATLIKAKWPLRVVGVLLVAMMAVTADYAAGNPRKQAHLVHEFFRPGEKGKTLVIVSPDWYHLQIAYYYDRAIFEDARNTHKRLTKEGFLMVEKMTPELGNEIQAHEYIVYVDSWAALIDPAESVKHFLNTNLRKTKCVDSVNGLTVSYYEHW